MIKWLTLTEKRRKEIINNINFETGLSVTAIEKDWYVTLALHAVFQTPWANEIVFKGGTSLSKGWDLISRFSEDVDLAISPTALGMDPKNITTGTHIKKLRKANGTFMEGPFLEALTAQLRNMDITQEMLDIRIRQAKYSDEDPRIIELEFSSLFEVEDGYVKKKVDLEIGARSLREPFQLRSIRSIIDGALPAFDTGIPAFEVPTVTPDRTFLEKMFLLHEEFTKDVAKMRHYRMSRHLYDLYYVADSDFGKSALQDNDLFEIIRNHRALYNEHEHIDYPTIVLPKMIIVPPPAVIALWENDYTQMRVSMMAKEPPTFQQILERLSGIPALIEGSSDKANP